VDANDGEFDEGQDCMLTRNGISDRGWDCAIAIMTGVLAVVTLSVGANVHAAQKKTGTFQDKTEALLKSGYVELSGDDAVRFLIGNSVVMKKTDAQPKEFPKPEYDRRYYFSDAHAAYQCAGNDCSLQSWKVDGNEICIEFPEQCDDANNRHFIAPRLFKAPRPDPRTGRIGIYLTTSRSSMLSSRETRPSRRCLNPTVPAR
jgi:hypothetical protein